MYFHTLMNFFYSHQVPTHNYLLLLKYVDVFHQAKLTEQLRQVVCYLGGGASLTAC